MKRTSLPERVGEILGGQDADARARRIVQRVAARDVPRWRLPVALVAGGSLLALTVLAGHFMVSEAGAPVAHPEDGLERGADLVAGHQSLGGGSWIRASEDVRAVVVESSPERLEILLEEGRIEVEIVPGGVRRVEIETGLARITVVGTHFVVGRDADAVQVSVSRGRVLVRGDLVPGRARIVTAGEDLTVREPLPVESPVEAPLEEIPTEASHLPPRRATPWRDLADTGAYGEAWEALGTEGLDREMRSSSPADLLALADVARRSGHPEEAVAPLERLLSRFPDDPDAALGAFTLGRLRADALGQPARAAEAFELALGGHLPSSLLPDTLSRLALAYEAAGEHDAARRTAERYLASYPGGARVGEMRAIADSR